MSAFRDYRAKFRANTARVGLASGSVLVAVALATHGCTGSSVVATERSLPASGGAGGSDPLLTLAGAPAEPVEAGTGGGIVGTLPPDFTEADAGGYKLGEPLDETDGAAGAPGDDQTAGNTCGNVLLGEV